MTKLIELLEKENIDHSLNEPMSAHTTFKIGGGADVFITARDEAELVSVINACRDSGIPFMILGNGSNLLISDNGIEGAVITLGEGFKHISVDGEYITAGAGAKLSKLCSVALDNSLSGLEFAYGIPGSVGGAMFMNAGAYGGEMKDVAVSVTALDPDGEIKEYPAEELGLGYRTSVFKTNGCIILNSKFKLHKDSKDAVRSRMDDFMDRRKTKQPLEYPSAGSVFKRPEGAFAGTLIEQCGLKGKTVGGAQVSEKHAGFIINIGSATCDDVTKLVSVIQDTIKAETGFELECEIIRTGR